ncbi:glycosyltransferase family 4 protein [Marinobacter sp. chi1]|uniref:Glycosyltransferase family 4 protein n=1 Tax=Marinobacter suaedae TaxID=3057675 RepID=A0ABT8VWG5_9GAMM|nr:glycosyltransferase family 4 protein [Marinobacter sp. chi1]MDO3720314.1 glycosyltransferase family 4 protein [Marinobacter sp. chi1]
MRILLLHNFYGTEAPSGENVVFEAEKTLLEQRGHSVRLFTRHSDEIRGKGAAGTLAGALSTPWNPFSAKALSQLVAEFRPDVVHAHNTFPLLSPAVFHAVGKRAATVLTLHNYRLFCSAGIPMRAGRVCTDCITRHSVQPALRHGCYRGSRVATVPLALNVAMHRRLGTWQQKVDAFVALSDFQRRLMAKGGLPAEKMHVKPNFYAGQPPVLPFDARDGQVVFVGRLGREKGVHTLIEAWRKWGSNAPKLKIVGDGPLRAELQNRAEGLPIVFAGQVGAEEAQQAIAHARLVVLPSECFEGFPMVVREAFAFGTPVAVSNLGPLPDIVRHGENGVVFEPANAASLLATVREAWQAPGLLPCLAEGARREFETKYNEQANYEILMNIYQQAVERNRAEV